MTTTATVYALWSAPRARSTAFFRSMVERGDVIAVHEPFFNVAAFGRTEIGETSITSHSTLLAHLRDRGDAPSVFFKETTDHRYEVVLADQRFLAQARHAFLIRRPEEVAASYHALYPELQRHEVGLETLHELCTAVENAAGHDPIVIDSVDLVARPQATMRAYCQAVAIPFLPGALTWTPADRPEWGRTARWHRRTAASSGFDDGVRRYEQTAQEAERLAAYAAYHRPFYDELRARRLVVPPDSVGGLDRSEVETVRHGHGGQRGGGPVD